MKCRSADQNGRVKVAEKRIDQISIKNTISRGNCHFDHQFCIVILSARSNLVYRRQRH